jgi:hypothetical protein
MSDNTPSARLQQSPRTSTGPQPAPPSEAHSDIPRAGNDYLGSAPLPTNQNEIIQECVNFRLITEVEIGWMNFQNRDAQPTKFLNEQARVYASLVVRWMTKAAREGNTEFIHNLARGFEAAKTEESAIPMGKVQRELIHSASELAREKRNEELNEELNLLAALRDSNTSEAEIKKIRNDLMQRSVGVVSTAEFENIVPSEGGMLGHIKVGKTIYQTAEPETREPTQSEVLKHWEEKTGRSRDKINRAREFKAAKLKLPKAHAGRKPSIRRGRRALHRNCRQK